MSPADVLSQLAAALGGVGGFGVQKLDIVLEAGQTTQASIDAHAGGLMIVGDQYATSATNMLLVSSSIILVADGAGGVAPGSSNVDVTKNNTSNQIVFTLGGTKSVIGGFYIYRL